ncbi:MAG: hypothetical protein AAFR90_14995 [Pseudomonadota bacterium]
MRHFSETEIPIKFDADPLIIREALTVYFHSPMNEWSEGLVADLHRVAELGTGEGLQIILNEARRQDIDLYPEFETDTGIDAPPEHDPKHISLHVYLHHHSIFEAAADFQALRAPNSMAEFRGAERDVDADLTKSKKDAFKDTIKRLLIQDLHGEYCRLGPYEEQGEINLVVSHGAPVTTTPVVSGNREDVITLRAVKYAVLRYSSAEGLLRIGGVAKSRQDDVAEIFSNYILARPGFFAGEAARDLYTLEPASEAGPDFEFDYKYDDSIQDVRIVAAAADLFEIDEDGKRRHVRTWESTDRSGAALRHFKNSEVQFGHGWRLGEMTFRVFFNTGAKRPAQVTVRLKPPGTLAFRRTRFEKAIHTLVARNGLEKEHDARMVMDKTE